MSERQLKLKTTRCTFMTLGFMLVVCVSGVLPTLSMQNPQTIQFYGTIKYSVFVPPNGYCYHSAFVGFGGIAPSRTEAESAILRFTSIVGKGLLLYNIAGTLMWNELLWMCMPGDHNFKPLIEGGLIQGIMIGLWPMLRGQNNDSLTVQQIEEGTWDSYIMKIADQAKAFGYPIFIRIGSEMNINQGGGRPSFGENASAFVGAWRRIVNTFKSEGATNVVFVWNPNWADIGPNHWTDYYPGDEYVDWVGIDLYQFQPDSDPRTMLQVYDDYGRGNR
jgi:hypothetical protein